MSWLETALNGIAVQLKSLKENKLNKDEAFKIFQKKSDSFSGRWSDLKGKPKLSKVAISGEWEDINNSPVCITEGLNWKTTGGYFSNSICAVGVLNNQNIMIRITSNGTIYESTDGKDWSLSNSQLPSDFMLPYGDAIIANNCIIVTQISGNKIAVKNGYGGYVLYDVPSYNNWQYITYGGDKFIILAADSDIAAYSTDKGQTWTQITLPRSGNWSSICCRTDYTYYPYYEFIITNHDDSTILQSKNGTVWTSLTFQNESLENYGCKYAAVCGNVVFMISNGYCDNVIYNSGYGWTQLDFPDSINGILRHVGYSNNRFYFMFDRIYRVSSLNYSTKFIPISCNSNVFASSKRIFTFNDMFISVNQYLYYAELCLYSDGYDITQSLQASMQSGYAKVANTGDYNDLNNKPQLSTVATTGKYSDLLSTPDTLEYNLILSETINTSLKYRVEAYGAGVFVAFCYNNRGDTEYAAYSVDCINWTKTKLPQCTQWRKIIYGGNKFVALGGSANGLDNSSLVAYSEDGIIWEETNLPVELAHWMTITYGNGRFVAVALGANVAAYSLDGITWEQSILPREMSVRDMTFGNGKFIGVTDDGAALISTDGINWTEEIISRSCSPSSIAYGNGTFVAISNQYGRNKAYYNNGWKWFDVDINFRASQIIYGDGKFIAASTDSSRFNYSKDGINWKSGTGHDGHLFYGGNKLILTSSHKISFFGYGTFVEGKNVTSDIRGYEGKLAAVATSGSYNDLSNRPSIPEAFKIHICGVDWANASPIPNFSSYPLYIAIGNGVAIVATTDSAYHTTDWENWEVYTTHSCGMDNILLLKYTNNKFVCITTNDNISSVYYGDDGVNWEQSSQLPRNARWSDIAYGNGRYIAISNRITLHDSGSTLAACSNDDGVSWVEIELPKFSIWDNIIYANDKFIITSPNSQNILCSADGETWEIMSAPFKISDTVYTGERFVICNAITKQVAYSENLSNWTIVDLPGSLHGYRMAYGNGVIVATTFQDKYAYYSIDHGTSWNVIDFQYDNVYNVVYGDNKFIMSKKGGVKYSQSAILIGDNDITDKFKLILKND